MATIVEKANKKKIEMSKKKNIINAKKKDFKKLLGKQDAPKMVSEASHSAPSEQEIIEVSSSVKPANVFSTMTVYGGKAMAGEERKEKISKIIDSWNSMKGLDDLCSVVNMVRQVLYGENAAKTSVDRLKKLAYKGRYVSFKIPKKKNGEFRSIDAPCPELKNVQQALNFVLEEVYNPNAAAMGFVRNRSVVTNAQVHLGQNFVYNIDLKDFFPSISSGRLYKRLMVKPFCLNKEVAGIISDLCCYKKGNHKVLPQGAPTSPTITNIICERLDIKLTRLAKAYGLKYTRYADDITFSGMRNLFAEDGKFCTSMRNIIENEENFKINSNKTRLCHRRMRQEVTGLTVNSKTNVSRKYIKQLRPLIHNWEVKGYAEAQSIFVKQYAKTNTRNLKFNGEHHIENIISGKLLYLKMVKGETDPTYKSYANRFERLCDETFGSGAKKPREQLTTSIKDGNILSALNNLATLIETNTSE